jgi:hypothetical protein
MNRRELERRDAANRFWPGMNSELRSTPIGVTLHPRVLSEWRHPWNIDMAFVDQRWRATVNPGFVNGRPAFIDMPATWLAEQVKSGAASQRDFGINPLTGRPYFEAWVFNHERGESPERAKGTGGPVRLTNSPAPYMVLGAWRNPAAAAGVSVSETGDIRVGAAEGYPKYFDSLGVRPPAGAGSLNQLATQSAEFDPSRTREIRAVDIVLTQPRIGAKLEFVPGHPIADVATAQISTNYLRDYVKLHNGRARLRATTKYQPLPDDPIEATFGTLLNGDDPQFDELHMATVWMLSPPGADSDAEPDGTWEPFVQHFVFWNLNHAPRNIPPSSPNEDNIVFIVPLALGTAQGVINGIVSVLNGMLNEALTFLRDAGDVRGKFWTT